MKTRNLFRKAAALFACFLIINALPAALAADVFRYDANGNMVEDSSKGQCYEYNDANKLKKVTNCAGATIAEYWYDYTGRKIKSIEGAVTTCYPFPDYEERVYSDGRKETSIYVRANGEIVARKDIDSQGVEKTYYYHGDHLGSTSVITDQAGNVVERTSYLPFGKTKAGGAKSGTHLYTGQELIASTGLYDYGARYYDPQLMHFTQPDTMVQNVYDPQSLNRYSYVKNNPLKYNDPTGNEAMLAIGLSYYISAVPPLALIVGGSVIFVYCSNQAFKQSVELYTYLTENPNLDPTKNDQYVNAEDDTNVYPYGQGPPIKKEDLEKQQQLRNEIDSRMSGYEKQLRKETLEAAKTESSGGSVGMNPEKGRSWNHIEKVKNAQQGLKDYISRLENRFNYGKTPEWEREVIKPALENAKKLLEESYKYLPTDK